MLILSFLLEAVLVTSPTREGVTFENSTRGESQRAEPELKVYTAIYLI